MSQLQTFLSDLFDISFSKFIAPRIVGLLYLVGILFAGLFALTFIFGSIGAIFTGGQSTFLGILGLLLSPLMFLLYVTFVRVGILFAGLFALTFIFGSIGAIFTD
ncbi:MAG: DUF4282 domain-containing protein [Cyanobacteria bacterium J06639_18]